MVSEKVNHDIAPVEQQHEFMSPEEKEHEKYEVFKKTTDGVQFRTVGWPRACIIFLKLIFAMGILTIPTAMYNLGAVGGTLSLVGWQALNTYCAVIQGNFRNRHPECHSLADMGYLVGGVWLKEVIGFIFLVAYILCTGSGILALSVGFNALSNHGACTVWWAFLAMAIITACASVRTFNKIGWLMWIGFFSLFIAVFVVVVGVTTLDRPAAAPPTGDYDLGFHAINYPTFAEGITATATIFISSAGTSAFLPVIAEMKRPQDYNKALYVCMGFVLAVYIAFALVVYRYCGKWVANPSLGSAGETLKKVAYGIGLIGLVVSGCIYQHVAAKYIFVRVLRNSRHLQSNTVVHWSVWLGCTITLGAISFILAEAIVIFNYLLALAGSICFAPMALIIPGVLYLWDYGEYRTGTSMEKAKYWSHVFIILLGTFLTIGGTYGTAISIKAAYDSGQIGSAFSCADNSGYTSA